MGFAIIRQEKVKGAESFNSRTSHNNRTIITSNINKSLTKNNIMIQENIYKNYDDFVNKKRKEIQEHNLEFGTKNRFIRKTLNKKNKTMEFGAMSQEFIISSSKDFFKTEEENIQYLKNADKFLRKWFPNCEVLQSSIHLDETTPHLHFHISYFDKENKKFIQKEMSKKGLTDINKIREAFQTDIASPIGLQKQNGSVVNADEHQNKASLEIAQLKKELSEARKTILMQKERISKLEEEKSLLEQDMIVLEHKNNSNLGMNPTIKKELTKTKSELLKYQNTLEAIVDSVGTDNTEDLINKIEEKFSEPRLETKEEQEERYRLSDEEFFKENGVKPEIWETLSYKEMKENNNQRKIIKQR